MTVEAENLLEQKKADNDFATAYKQAKDILDDEESILKTYGHNRYKLGKEEGQEIGIKKGEEIGIKKGEEIGFKQGRNQMVAMMRQNGKSLQEIADFMNISVHDLDID